MNIRKRLLLLCAGLLLAMSIWPGAPLPGYAASPFKLEVSEAEGRVEVVVTALEAKDVYAWDLTIAYDPLRLRWLDASTALAGFAVPPIHAAGTVRFAHTNTGAMNGRGGSIELARFEFRRIRGGDAKLGLADVKLVDSGLAMEDYTEAASAAAAAQEAPAQPVDLEGHWAKATVLEALSLGFAAGFADGTFRPDRPITRQELTVLLARALLPDAGRRGAALDRPDGKEEPSEAQTASELAASFADAEDIAPWAAPYVLEAARSQWVNGYADGTFRGASHVTRQELAAMVARAAGYVAAGSAPAGEERSRAAAERLAGYADRGELQPWAEEPMARLVEAGILRGNAEQRLKPNDATTRAEATAVLLRLLEAQSRQ